MTKNSARQKQITKNRKLLKRNAKAKKKSKVKARSKSCKKSGELQLDEKFMLESLVRRNNENDQSIKTTFSEILKEYSKIDTASVFSSLLLNPSFQSSQYRLEKAIVICLSFCNGDKKPDLNLIKFIFKKLDDLGFVCMEDPAEDVFISTVWFEGNQYKVSTGLWEGGIYEAQIFLDFINAAPNNEKHIFIKNRLRAVLKASDFIITRIGLNINEIGAGYPLTEINYDELSDLNELIYKVKLHDFDESKFLPHIDINDQSELYMQEFGESDLEASPFFVDGNICSLISPSSILVCIKRQIINFVRENYSDEMLDDLFFNYQAKKIHETNLLRKFEHIPINFFKIKGIDDWRYFEFLVDFDKGYFLHFIFLGESLR
ncbi:MAG: hypothetical protein Q8K92_09185, partial [Leadbetterella sp.]|nr:hypothetical protein [Leadbetterella sp.]